MKEPFAPTIYQVSAYYPPHLGGVEQVVESLSEKLLELGYSVTVLTSDSVEGRKITPRKHVKFLRSFEFAHTPFAPTLLLKLLKIRKNSTVHLHVAQAYFPEATWIASKIKGFPYLAHFHLDVQASGPLGFIFTIYKKTLLGLVLRSAERVVVFSKPQKDLVVRLHRVNPKKVIIIPNGISEDFFVSRRPNKIPHILYAGRLVRAQKHVERIIEAAPFINHKVEIDLVGDGEDRKDLQALTKSLNLSNIHFHGAKNHTDLIKFYRNSDIFVLPSDGEGMPLVLLEAMAAGLPIVGSDVPGIRELIEETGVLVDPAPNNFASAINELLENKALSKTLSDNSSSKAKNFQWSNLVTSFEKIYQQVANATN